MNNITIRMGAAEYSLTAGSVKIDLSTCSKEDRYQARRTLIETLKRRGYFRDAPRKAA